MLLGLQKRHDFLETLATLQVSIHDDICFKAALLFLFYGVRHKCCRQPSKQASIDGIPGHVKT